MTVSTKFSRPVGTGRHWIKRAVLGTAVAAGMLAAATGALRAEEKVLRVAMTAADIPINIGQPDQGFEGFGHVADMEFAEHARPKRCHADFTGVNTSNSSGPSDLTAFNDELTPTTMLTLADHTVSETAQVGRSRQLRIHERERN